MPTPSNPLKAVRGTRDLLPPETALWNRVESIARSVFSRYGFGEIRTPIFEDTQLFARGVGEETDIVSKEMYTWEDGERFDRIALRDAWHRLHEGDYGDEERYDPSPSGPQHIAYLMNLNNLEGGAPEYVAFAYKAEVGVLKELGTYVEDLRKGRWGLPNAVGRLVLPSPISKPDERYDDAIIIEYVKGSFVKSSQSLTLRPENTAGVVRAYIEHNLGDTGQLQKLYYIGPQFRRERPQRGRYRQFWQIGAEVLGPVTSGSESPLRDAEVLEMLATLLDELGIQGWRLELNSVGSAEDRKRYVAILRDALAPIKHQLCEDNQRRAETNPLRVLDSKDPADQALIDGLPKIADYLDDSSRDHFAQVLAALDACGVPYVINPRLVRGLDYYTRTTFEFTVPSSADPASGLGTQNALLGGGRYDGLSEMLGGPRAPGIGFAIGEDRLILTLQAQAEAAGGAASEKELDVYIAPMGVEQNLVALKLARELRHSRLTVEVGDGSFKAGKSKEIAELKARRIVFVGALESDAGLFFAEDFKTDQVRPLSRKELPIELGKPSWPISDQLVRSSNPLEQVLAIRLAVLLILEASEKPMSSESLRIFSALSLREPPRRLQAESIQLATTDLKAEEFIELQEDGWVITDAGRNYANQQLTLERESEEAEVGRSVKSRKLQQSK
jgi:histidyl-tRNA synthetase